MPKISFEEAQKRVLIRFYWMAIYTISDEQIHISYFHRIRPNHIGKFLFEKAAIHLVERGLLEHPDGYEGIFSISPKGLSYVEENLEHPLEANYPADHEWAVNLRSEEAGEQPNSEGTGEREELPESIEFEGFKMAMLSVLAHENEESGTQKYNLADLAENAGVHYRLGWIGQVGEEFHREGLADVETNLDYGPDVHVLAQITEEGRRMLDSQREVTGESSKTPATLVAASDRFVTLDHNSRAYRDAVDAVDKVIEAVAGDNEYGSESPEEKEAVVGALGAARKLLDAVEVRISAVQTILLPPLQYIADNFSKGAVAALGAAAVAAVMKLFGLL